MASKADKNLMTAIVLGGAAVVGIALYRMSRAPQPVASAGGGMGAVIAFQPQRRRLSGWGSYGTPGFNGIGRTGAAVYWRRVG